MVEAEGSAAESKESGREIRWVQVERGVVVAAAFVYAIFVWRTSAVVDGHRTFTLFDDAMISMRYGRNVVDGHGLVFNPGQHVEGYTNLLWTLGMGVVQLIARPRRLAPGAVSLVGGAVLIANVFVVRSFSRRLSASPWVPAVAMVAVGFSYSLMFWTLRGMEVGLLALLLTTAAYLTFRCDGQVRGRDAFAIAALLGLAVFTRDDATVVGLVILIFLVAGIKKGRRFSATATALAGLVLVIGARLALRWVLYGKLVPNTYVLKVEGIPKHLLLGRGLLGFGYVLAFGLAVPVGLALLAYSHNDSRSARRGVVLLGAIVGAQVAYSIVVGGDAWDDLGFANRFLATVVGPLSLLAVVGVANLTRGTMSKRRMLLAFTPLCGSVLFTIVAPRFTRYFQLGDRAPDNGSHEYIRLALLLLTIGVVGAAGFTARPRLVIVFTAGMLVVAAPNILPFGSWLRSNQQFQASDVGWARYGLRLKAATSPTATIAASSIGNIGYFSERPIVDLLGKTDPAIAHSPPRTTFWMLPGHMRWDYRHSIVALRPDVVAEIFGPTPGDYSMIEAAGYRRVPSTNKVITYVRADSALVNQALMRRAADVAR